MTRTPLEKFLNFFENFQDFVKIKKFKSKKKFLRRKIEINSGSNRNSSDPRSPQWILWMILIVIWQWDQNEFLIRHLKNHPFLLYDSFWSFLDDISVSKIGQNGCYGQKRLIFTENTDFLNENCHFLTEMKQNQVSPRRRHPQL